MNKPTSPLHEQEVLDLYFLENRARLLEIASFLDRLDRAEGGGGDRKEYRVVAFNRALGLLMEKGGGRTRAIQLSLSDRSTEPLASAVGLKATGAWGGGHEGN